MYHRTDVRAELWVGGGDSLVGELLTTEHLRGAWLVDCAGELPPGLADGVSQLYTRVFADIESVPSSLDRLVGLSRELAAALTPDGDATGPEKLFVMCSQGLNRSALVAGLILRELGAAPADIVREIQRSRPGSLSNATFVRLLFGE